MSSENFKLAQSAVTTKGPRKRPRNDADSGEQRSEEFRGCRDLPSPVNPGRVYRAPKSRPMYHRIILETPLMHRHDLEWQMEELWENYGIEYRFLRSSEDVSALDLYEGPPSPTASQTDTSSAAIPTQQVVKMQLLVGGSVSVPSVLLSEQDVPVRASPGRVSGLNPGPR